MMTRLEMEDLALYNRERSRGITHTPEREAAMRDAQRRFDAELSETIAHPPKGYSRFAPLRAVQVIIDWYLAPAITLLVIVALWALGMWWAFHL